jgi:hypothetical protein
LRSASPRRHCAAAILTPPQRVHPQEFDCVAPCSTGSRVQRRKLQHGRQRIDAKDASRILRKPRDFTSWPVRVPCPG